MRYDPKELKKIWSKLSDPERNIFNDNSLFNRYIYEEIYYLVSTEDGLYFKGIKSGKLERLYAEQQKRLLILKKALTKKEFEYLLKVDARGRNSFSKFSKVDRESEIKHVEKKYTKLLKKDTERALRKFINYYTSYPKHLSKTMEKRFMKVIDENQNMILKFMGEPFYSVSSPENTKFGSPSPLAVNSSKILSKLIYNKKYDEKYIESIIKLGKKENYLSIQLLLFNSGINAADPSWGILKVKNEKRFKTISNILLDKLLSEDEKISHYSIRTLIKLFRQELVDKKYFRILIKQIGLYHKDIQTKYGDSGELYCYREMSDFILDLIGQDKLSNEDRSDALKLIRERALPETNFPSDADVAKLVKKHRKHKKVVRKGPRSDIILPKSLRLTIFIIAILWLMWRYL